MKIGKKKDNNASVFRYNIYIYRERERERFIAHGPLFLISSIAIQEQDQDGRELKINFQNFND